MLGREDRPHHASMTLHEDYMRQAIALAQEAASAGEIPVGAVVVYKGQVIGRAGNAREASHDPTAHAEILAMRQAAEHLGDWRLGGCILYVTLEPCPMCAGAAAMARVSQIIFGALDEKAGCCGSAYDIPGDGVFGRSIPSLGGVLAKECIEVIKQGHQAIRDNRVT